MNNRTDDHLLSILQVSTTDYGGGAAKVPWDLFRAYRKRGHHSMLAVGYRYGFADSDIFEIPNNRYRSPWARLLYAIPTFWQRHRLRGETRLRGILLPLAEPHRAKYLASGREDFDYPASSKLLDLLKGRPDIVHCHNLHGGYFDLRVLPKLSSRLPVILNLHDMWALTGHCAYSLDCERWRIGCGQCPDLTLSPAVPRDATAQNWQLKRDIFASSRLFVCTPSQWLTDKARQSMLKAEEYRTIYNGVNLSVFHPDEQRRVRLTLGLPLDVRILLFVGSRAQENRYKDYTTIETAVQEIANRVEGQEVIFVSLGGRRDTVSQIGPCQVRHYAFRGQQEEVARFYQAADVFLHAANADTFPTTILEALACGLPVIATAVGGIPEQVADGTTGFLVPQGDAAGMAARTVHLLEDEPFRQRLAQQAADVARKKFDLERQVSDYLSWYREILTREGQRQHGG